MPDSFEKKAAGMCPHGNFPSKCSICAVEGAEFSAEVAEYIEAELSKEVDIERKKELTDELAGIAEFMDQAGVNFYLAGGSGLDLLDGEWNRDHQDVDAAISTKDKSKFFDTAVADGYVLTDPYRNQFSRDDVVEGGLHNAFLFRNDERGVSQFEIIFLPETDDGIKLTNGIDISKAEYDEMAPRVTVANHEIALQPPEVIMFYKITDGRRKDFIDIKKIWVSLSTEQRDKIQAWLETGGFEFSLQEKKTSNIEELLRLAEQEDSEKSQMFFSEDVKRIEKEFLDDFNKTFEEIWNIRQGSESRDDFLQKATEKYDRPEHRQVLEQVAHYLFSDEVTDLKGFKKWSRKLIKIDEQIKPKALSRYKEQRLWAVSSKTN